MDIINWDIEILQHKSGLFPTKWISFTINKLLMTINQSPHATNNVQKSEWSIKPKIVNIVNRVRGKVLQYSKIQFVLSKIVGQLLYSENKDTNKYFLEEVLQHKLKVGERGLSYFISNFIGFIILKQKSRGRAKF